METSLSEDMQQVESTLREAFLTSYELCPMTVIHESQDKGLYILNMMGVEGSKASLEQALSLNLVNTIDPNLTQNISYVPGVKELLTTWTQRQMEEAKKMKSFKVE